LENAPEKIILRPGDHFRLSLEVMSAGAPQPSNFISHEEFATFLNAFNHALRNRLNNIALEAGDLAEQVGAQADATRLQQQVRECAAFLKGVREALAPDNPQAEKMALADLVKKLREASV